MTMQTTGSAASRNSFSTAEIKSKIPVGKMTNGPVTGHKGGPDHGSTPGKAVTGFTTSVKPGKV